MKTSNFPNCPGRARLPREILTACPTFDIMLMHCISKRYLIWTQGTLEAFGPAVRYARPAGVC